jgi:hypothetical protein
MSLLRFVSFFSSLFVLSCAQDVPRVLLPSDTTWSQLAWGGSWRCGVLTRGIGATDNTVMQMVDVDLGKQVSPQLTT